MKFLLVCLIQPNETFLSSYWVWLWLWLKFRLRLTIMYEFSIKVLGLDDG